MFKSIDFYFLLLFIFQELDEFEVRIEGETLEGSNGAKADNSRDMLCGNSRSEDKSINKSAKQQANRDESVKMRLISVVSSLQTSARYVCTSKAL